MVAQRMMALRRSITAVTGNIKRRHNVTFSTINSHNCTIMSAHTNRRYLSFQSTRIIRKEATAVDDSQKQKTEKEEEEEEIPSFQNPLHHTSTPPEIELSKLPPGTEPVPLPPFDDGSGKVVAPPHLHQLAEDMTHMSMIEMKELVDRVADHFGIEEDDSMDYDDGEEGGGSGGGEEEAKEEEKTAFDIKLMSFDAKSKIKIIKEVRSITSLGLKEAKAMVEGAPGVVKKDLKKEEAEELKEKLEGVGAVVEIV